MVATSGYTLVTSSFYRDGLSAEFHSRCIEAGLVHRSAGIRSGVFISEEAEEQDSHNYDAKSDESDADQLREPEGNNTESHNHSSRNDSRQAVRALRLCIFTAIL